MSDSNVSEADLVYRKRTRIFKVAIGILVLTVLATVAGTIYFISNFEFTEWTLRQLGIDQAERDILVELSDVAGEEIGLVSPNYAQTWNRYRDLSGTSILYSGNRTGIGAEFVVYSSILAANNPEEARSALGTPGENASDALREMKSRGLERVRSDELFRAGDESRLVLLRDQGQPAGFQFRVLSGRHILHATVIGVPYETPEALSELLGPRVQKLSGYSPTPHRGR